MSTGSAAPESRVLLRKATWEQYVSLRDARENSRMRMTYDRGELEIMSPSKPHERLGYLIGRFIDIWTLDRRIPIQSCRSTTFRRMDLRRGVEPDNCYYIENEAVVRDREDADLAIDPPPDLVVEVDVTSKSIARLPIYAALGVPEVWQWRDETMHVLRLKSRKYVKVRASQALPGCPCARMVALIKLHVSLDETTLIRRFQILCQRKKRP